MEEGQRLKVIYGSLSGFHAIDVDSGTPYDLYLPTHVGDKLLLLMLQTLNIMTTRQHIKQLCENSSGESVGGVCQMGAVIAY